jgi:hypothetical protein
MPWLADYASDAVSAYDKMVAALCVPGKDAQQRGGQKNVLVFGVSESTFSALKGPKGVLSAVSKSTARALGVFSSSEGGGYLRALVAFEQVSSPLLVHGRVVIAAEAGVLFWPKTDLHHFPFPAWP